jgi:hypothetical protein
MVFINNKYTKIYFRLIDRSLSRTFFENVYTEKHHIIPKSLGGTDHHDNLAVLTAKEHYICHLLLIKMVDGYAKTKMRYAAYKLTQINKNQHGRLKISGRQYEFLKNQMSLANRERPGPNRGKIMSEDQKEKISNTLKGRKLGPKSDEHRKKLSASAKNKIISQETKNKMSQARRGKKHSDNTKAKISSWQKGVSKPKVICEHCGKEISFLNHVRWHGEKCKKK